MQSEHLRNIIKVAEKKEKKVLFVNPQRSTATSRVPHMGIAILASILKKRGHDILVVDYNLIPRAPHITSFIDKFKPDVIGVSIYTANTGEAELILEEINNFNKEIPIIVGGPHPTLYPDEMQEDKRVDYIVIGEAELTVIDAVENAKKEDKAVIIRTTEIVNPEDVPFPEYRVFYKWEYIRAYSIMTSRGCPYRCSFCPVVSVSGKLWRPRKPESCIREIEHAMQTIAPNLHILVQDDNPLVDKERFYRFLKLYAEKIKLRLDITNIRADDVNEELLVSLKKANCNAVGLGVEHAHPEVFKQVNKGETLEQIEKAAKLVNKYKMLLSLGFIIGLPGDNLKRIKASIKFAQKLKPDSIYWNIVMPYKSTPIREWFEKNGTLYNEIGHTSLAEGDFRANEPVVETPDFTKEDRIKAHYMCLFETIDSKLKLTKLPQIFSEARKYNLYSEFFYWLPRGIMQNIKINLRVIQKAHAYYQREGFNELIKRINFLRSQ
ncbi:MAG: radical SAM protein [archaeon]